MGQIVWNWEYTNYGKSPAIHVRHDTFMSLDNGPFSRAPGASENSKGEAGTPLPPSKIDFDTVISKPGITTAEYNRLLTINKGISISGVIWYEDALGNEYETTFCLSRLNGGVISYQHIGKDCQNDIK